MTKLRKRFRAVPFLPVALVCFLAVGSTAVAFAGKEMRRRASNGRPEVSVTLDGSVKRDDKVLSVADVETVRPGEILDWAITSENKGTADANDYSALGQIPRGTSFVAGSAQGSGTKVTYSIDGGKTFAAQPLVEERQADGTVKRVPAPVSMYTQIRYEWSDALAAGGKLSASYKVRVN